MSRRKNRRALALGRRARASDRHPRSKGHSALLPALPGLDTATTTIDAHALADELVRLAILARRGWST